MRCSSLSKQSILFLGIVSIAVVLSGCNGNGGGTGVMSQQQQQEQQQQQQQQQELEPLSTVLNTEAIATGAVGALEKAAAADPNPGSVTQSSTTNEAGVTTDSVEVTAEYGTTPRFSVTNGDRWSIGMNEGNPVALTGFGLGVDWWTWKGAAFGKKLSDGTLYVNAYTNIEEPMAPVEEGTPVILENDPEGTRYTVESGAFNNRDGEPGTRDGVDGTFSCSTSRGRCPAFGGNIVDWSGTGWIFTPTTRGDGSPVQDTDYLAGGVWLYVPDTASSTDDYEFGAFADGSDPFTQSNIMALTGSATYLGDAVGVYSLKEASSTTIGNFDGDVRLTADFGAADSLGTISGVIDTFEVDGEAFPGSLTLGEAAIGSANSGFFKGAVAGSDDSRTYAGKWGGQFFGNGPASTDHPGQVAGTFGGTSTDDAVNFVGAFGAHVVRGTVGDSPSPEPVP